MGESIVGKVFQNIDDGIAFVEKYCRDGIHPVNCASGFSIAQYNNKIWAAERRRIIYLHKFITNTRILLQSNCAVTTN